MFWLILVIFAHLINAAALLATKFLLEKKIKNSAVLAVIIGFLSLLIIVAAPFGLQLPDALGLIIDLTSGALWIAAILVFNYLVQKFEVTKVAPIVGGAVPAFTLLLASIFLFEKLALIELVAFAFLTVGTVIIAYEKKMNSKFSWVLIFYSLFAGALFAGAFVLSKFAFDTQPFLSSFIWIRLGSFLAAVLLLLHPKILKDTWRFGKSALKNNKLILAITVVLSVLGFVLLNWAIAIGSVTIANSLQGVQYVFLLVAALLATKFFPKIYSEKFTRNILIQKIVAIILISAGVIVLSFSV
jgi:drug/metabolite transporter (DMT)-like permease